jgi:inner membrane protein
MSMTLPVPRLPRLPLLGKAIAVGAVLLALVVALGAVREIVAEREGRLREAQSGIAASLAASQTLLGPMAQRQCVETWERPVESGKERGTVVERAPVSVSQAPTALGIDASVAMEPRYRGIFKVNGYVLKAKLSATFADGKGIAVPAPRQPNGRVTCEAPTLYVALGDARGIRRAEMTLDGAPAAIRPGTENAAHARGFHVAAGAAFASAAAPLRAELVMELVGTGDLAFAPIGVDTQVTVASDWPHPSFAGRFLPVERAVRADGFRATWRTNALATTAPRSAAEFGRACALSAAPDDGVQPGTAAQPPCVETFGVAFIDPVDTYSLADRATKYGLLFIALTFVGVGVTELMRGVRVHPVQYGLVGAALAVFFLLLVSLAEHLAFGAAYAIAAAACTLLLGFYGAFVLGGTVGGALFGTGIAALYGVLYVLLQLEQTALLVGSGLVFAVITATMVATRRLDWYAVLDRMRNRGTAA